jgi:hypothetical protein
MTDKIQQRITRALAKAKKERAAMTPQQKAAMTRAYNKLRRKMEAEEAQHKAMLEKGRGMARELKASGDFLLFVDTASAFVDELVGQTKEIGHQYIEWILERQAAMSVERLLPDIRECHKYLLENEYTETNKFSYHSGEAFIVTGKKIKNKVMCLELQNYNLVYLIDDTFSNHPKFHVRRYWDRFEMPVEDNYELREAKEFSEKGIEWAIRQASNLVEQYADDILKNGYPDRPSLNWFKHKNFHVEYEDKWYMTQYQSYGDCRDRGYVLSYESGFSRITGKVDSVISSYGMAKMSAFWINNLQTTIEEDGGY